MLAKERRALFRDLPESFKVGHPLQDHSLSRRALPSWRLSETGRWRSGIAVQAAAVMQPEGCFSPAVLFLPEYMGFDSVAAQT